MAYQSTSFNDFVKLDRFIDPRFTHLVTELLPPLGKKGPWMAGGSVRKFMNGMENKADYDIFFTNAQQKADWCEQLTNRGGVQVAVNIFNNSFMLEGHLIQCIHHEFRNTLIQTMDRFDITICQFGFDGETLVWSDAASEDVRNCEFHYLGTSDPIYNLNRGFKYATEGYKPADGEVAKVLRRVARAPTSLKNNRKISGATVGHQAYIDRSPALINQMKPSDGSDPWVYAVTAPDPFVPVGTIKMSKPIPKYDTWQGITVPYDKIASATIKADKLIS